MKKIKWRKVITTILTYSEILFITLRACDVVDWAWWAVLSPAIVPWAVWLGGTVILEIATVIKQ